MDHEDQLAGRFESQRGRLRAVAYRMLGSAAEADDAVQEAWLRLARSDAGAIDNLAGWLTTVVGRICLDMLRTRTSRREEPLPARPEPAGGSDAGDEALLADDVGLALLVVLDRLGPDERVAFVLHDLFAVPFDQIAPIVERSPVTTKKLASRARHRVQGADTRAAALPAAELAQHRHLVDAFLTAARSGDIEGLLAVLAPDVVRRADRAAMPAGVATEVRGARAVAEETRGNVGRARIAVLALVDGTVGLVVAPRGRLTIALAFTVADGRISEIDVIADPARLQSLDLATLTTP